MIERQEWSFLGGTRILITGGTGSLGKQLVRMILDASTDAHIIIFSRDEYKQYDMQALYTQQELLRLRFFLGDVRDQQRLYRAMHGVDYVIHTAALKQVPAAEYNPFEFVKTNVLGAENVINACLDAGVRKVVALSTDKAANPINLYGATKLCSDKIFTAANSYSGGSGTQFSVVRYGNVVGSRGSVVPFFLSRWREGSLPITDPRMTRFWIKLEQGASLVLNALERMQGGETWVPKIPSMKVVDLARVISPEAEQRIVGIRPGEKLHECMVPIDDGRYTRDVGTAYAILPAGNQELWSFYDKQGCTVCPEDFEYRSDKNHIWLSEEQLASMIAGLSLPEVRGWAQQRGVLQEAH